MFKAAKVVWFNDGFEGTEIGALDGTSLKGKRLD